MAPRNERTLVAWCQRFNKADVFLKMTCVHPSLSLIAKGDNSKNSSSDNTSSDEEEEKRRDFAVAAFSVE
jgi:hypothetical protein